MGYEVETIRKDILGLWPRLNAGPVCDDSAAEVVYAACGAV